MRFLLENKEFVKFLIKFFTEIALIYFKINELSNELNKNIS